MRRDILPTKKLVALIIYQYACLCALAIVTLLSPHYYKQPYHTSALTGQMWVDELLRGHPQRIQDNLGVSLEVFVLLLGELHAYGGLQPSRDVSMEEKLAIFLY
ncbi:hypothetical protein DL96DRAFT_1465531, partial [Flagelloscypha sp. PMI_526]